MCDIDEKVADLLRSPLGCVFLAIINENSIHPAVAAVPKNSMHIAATAVRFVNKCEKDCVNVLDSLRIDSLKDLAYSILQDPKSRWWFAGSDIHNQAWIGASKDNSPSRGEFVSIPTNGLNSIQISGSGKPMNCGLYTSTLVQYSSSWQAFLDDKCNNVRKCKFGESPPKQWRLIAEAPPRVYEIASPFDWLDLAIKHRAKCSPEKNESIRRIRRIYPLIYRAKDKSEASFNAMSLRKWVTPNWTSVAKEFDAVHLTFGGMLTAEGVRVASDDGWSLLRFWSAESTLWLRWMFDTVEQLPDYVESESPFDIRFPRLKL